MQRQQALSNRKRAAPARCQPTVFGVPSEPAFPYMLSQKTTTPYLYSCYANPSTTLRGLSASAQQDFTHKGMDLPLGVADIDSYRVIARAPHCCCPIPHPEPERHFPANHLGERFVYHQIFPPAPAPPCFVETAQVLPKKWPRFRHASDHYQEA